MPCSHDPRTIHSPNPELGTSGREEVSLPLRAPPNGEEFSHCSKLSECSRVRSSGYVGLSGLQPTSAATAEELTPKDRLVVIDEIQRIPGLLNEVHRLIEQRRIRFLLTGSSARKLRQGGVNLLGGRARTKYLHPLTQGELGQHFDLGKFITRGGVFPPSISPTILAPILTPIPDPTWSRKSSRREPHETFRPSADS